MRGRDVVAHVERRDYGLNVAVTILDTDYSHIMRTDAGGAFWASRAAHDQNPEPTYIFPMDVFDAIVKASSDFLPPSTAQQIHLNDAVAVRDRLLAIVESKA